MFMPWEVLFSSMDLCHLKPAPVAEETAFAPFRKILHSARYLKVLCGSLTSKAQANFWDSKKVHIYLQSEVRLMNQWIVIGNVTRHITTLYIYIHTEIIINHFIKLHLVYTCTYVESTSVFQRHSKRCGGILQRTELKGPSTPCLGA